MVTPWILVLGAALSGSPSPSLADPAITAAELETHVRFLASDELQGRKTGTPENRKAAEYLARVFASSGLEPAGDEDTFLQKVPLERIEYTGQPELHFLKSDGETVIAKWGVDFDIAGGDLAPTGTLILSVIDVDDDVPEKDSPARAFFLDGDRKASRAWSKLLNQPGRCGMLLQIGSSTPGKEKDNPPRSPRNLRLVGTQSPPRVRLRAEWVDLARGGEFVSVSLEQPLERDPQRVGAGPPEPRPDHLHPEVESTRR